MHELAAVSFPGVAASTLILMSLRRAALDTSALALGLALVYTFLPVQSEVMLGLSHWYFPVALFTSTTLDKIKNFCVETQVSSVGT